MEKVNYQYLTMAGVADKINELVEWVNEIELEKRSLKKANRLPKPE